MPILSGLLLLSLFCTPLCHIAFKLMGRQLAKDRRHIRVPVNPRTIISKFSLQL